MSTLCTQSLNPHLLAHIHKVELCFPANMLPANRLWRRLTSETQRRTNVCRPQRGFLRWWKVNLDLIKTMGWVKFVSLLRTASALWGQNNSHNYEWIDRWLCLHQERLRGGRCRAACECDVLLSVYIISAALCTEASQRKSTSANCCWLHTSLGEASWVRSVSFYTIPPWNHGEVQILSFSDKMFCF